MSIEIDASCVDGSVGCYHLNLTIGRILEIVTTIKNHYVNVKYVRSSTELVDFKQ